MAGFEPTTSSSRTKRATKLRHTPCAAGVSIASPHRGEEIGSAESSVTSRAVPLGPRLAADDVPDRLLLVTGSVAGAPQGVSKAPVPGGRPKEYKKRKRKSDKIEAVGGE